jgi:hypothetical protein
MTTTIDLLMWRRVSLATINLISTIPITKFRLSLPYFEEYNQMPSYSMSLSRRVNDTHQCIPCFDIRASENGAMLRPYILLPVVPLLTVFSGRCTCMFKTVVSTPEYCDVKLSDNFEGHRTSIYHTCILLYRLIRLFINFAFSPLFKKQKVNRKNDKVTLAYLICLW